jgi:hypothetical protein
MEMRSPSGDGDGEDARLGRAFAFFFAVGTTRRVANRQNAILQNSRGNAGTRENERRRGADEIFDCVMDGCAAHVDVRANERTRKGLRTTR